MKTKQNESRIRLILISISMIFIIINIFIFVNLSNKDSEGQDTKEELFYERKDVLLLYSYSPSFDTYFPLINGLESTLLDYNVQMDIECMDTKRFNDETNISNFYDSLKYKIDDIEKYDIIIASDDNAVKFVLEHRAELFDNIPLLYLGVNNVELAKMASDLPDVYGIVESISIKGTLDVATKLYPDAKNINIIVDGTASGRANLEIYKEEQKSFPDYNHIYLDLKDLSYDEFAEKLNKLDSNDIVLFMAGYQDKDGVNKTSSSASEHVANNCSQPIFALFDYQIGDKGVVGGMVASHYDMGEYIADIAIEILSNQDLKYVPKLTMSRNKYMYDYNKIESYGLDLKVLPINSEIVNKKPTFIEGNKEYIFFIVTLILFQLIIIIFLIYSLNLKEKTRKFLQNENFTDELTNIYNRRKLISDYDNGFFIGKSFAFLDVDNFKLVNDVHGHIFGDVVLEELSRRLSKIPSCTTYRIAGDEFVVIIEDKNVAKNFKAHMDKLLKPITYEDIFYEPSVSVGIMEDMEAELRIEDVISFTDIAMYKSKQDVDKINYVDNELKNKYIDEKVTQRNLVKAVENKELLAYYQPIVSIKNGKIIGFETLARWDYNGNIISAADFIDIAKGLNIISEIDLLMLEKLNIAYRENDFDSELIFTVNLSNDSLKSLQNNHEMWWEEFDKLVIPKRNLLFEISEHVNLTEDIKKALSDITNKYGFDYLIGDYGKWESKISHINDFSFNTVKLDVSVLPKGDASEQQVELFKSFIEFMHGINKSVVVEGVETLEQLETCIRAGAEYVQGCYLSKPLKLSEAVNVISIHDYRKS